jgi:hypothetical protein
MMEPAPVSGQADVVRTAKTKLRCTEAQCKHGITDCPRWHRAGMMLESGCRTTHEEKVSCQQLLDPGVVLELSRRSRERRPLRAECVAALGR